ncbi:DNA-directed RNA polymerase I subunit rpa49 [Coemansia sp. RSA 552]|nr:DNA-directed RNA polymerase I subunit rpa49 [Coemansia sp. RSA 552]
MGSKRKASDRASVDGESKKANKVSISIDSSKARVQPVLATFAAAVPRVASEFATYKNAENGDQCIVVNETEKIEYVGQSFEGDRPLVSGCRYLVGVYDKATDTVTFRRAPYVRVNSAIKSLKGSQGVPDRDMSDQILQARNELGQAFGSKKRKAQIRAEERNRINMDGVKKDMDVIGASIEKRTSSMPSAQDLKAEEDTNRPIPRYDPSAEAVAEIYDMDDVLPPEVAGHINVTPFIAAGADPEEYKSHVPVRSSFVHKKLGRILAQPKPDLGQLRRVLYLAYLMRLTALSRGMMQKRESYLKALNCGPEVADAVLDKFAECEAGSVNPDGFPVYTKTPATSNRLICYIAVLMLSLNEWILYPAELAADLGLPSRKAEQYLLSVGCKMEAASKSEIEALSLGKRGQATKGKKAVLRAPVQFPKASLRGR